MKISLTKNDGLALLLSALAVLLSFAVAHFIFETLPHTEDEISYLWQARVFAGGHLNLASPPHAEQMFVPFVVECQGHRFSKYPPGWSLVLALGVLANAQAWVNPLLGGVIVWVTYLLGKKFLDEKSALLASALTVFSPFFLLNSGSFLSSNLSLLLTGFFILNWFNTLDSTSGFSPLAAGLSLGFLALTRPLTALAVAFPFAVQGLILLGRGNNSTRIRIILVGVITALVASLLFIWVYLMTGNPFLDPYTLWWKYDRIGFGKGIGIDPEGHTLVRALDDMAIMLVACARDLFGWEYFSWLFLIPGAYAIRKNKPGLMPAVVFVSLVLFYMLYWAEVTRFGPRYYYEGLYGLTLLSAAGIFWLAVQSKTWKIFTAVTLSVLMFYNLVVYLPARLDSMRAIYGITRAQFKPFETVEAKKSTPGLVFVHLNDETKYGEFYGGWSQYGGLLELQSPQLDSPFIFAVSRGAEKDALLAADYPSRRVAQYFPQKKLLIFDAP